jgi:hypothetical protein
MGNQKFGSKSRLIVAHPLGAYFDHYRIAVQAESDLLRAVGIQMTWVNPWRRP